MWKRWLCALLLLLWIQPALAVEQAPVLDAALSMLEEGNVFLERYNYLTGAEIAARYPLGCPYFWGGRAERKILDLISPWQDTSSYYHPKRLYLYGFDCAGFTMWALQQAGAPQHPSTSALLKPTQYTELELTRAERLRGAKRAKALTVGDLVVMRHPNGVNHIALFIGTLRDFGYLPELLPEELQPYVDYPLLIHCTGSSDYYERYEAYLEDTYQQRVYPPDGGVIVTLLDVPPEAAPEQMLTPNNVYKPYFLLEGYKLQVTDLSGEDAVRWIRWW